MKIVRIINEENREELGILHGCMLACDICGTRKLTGNNFIAVRAHYRRFHDIMYTRLEIMESNDLVDTK